LQWHACQSGYTSKHVFYIKSHARAEGKSWSGEGGEKRYVVSE